MSVLTHIKIYCDIFANMLREKENIKVSYYKNKESRNGLHLNLFDAITLNDFKQQVERIRACEYHSDEYDSLKKELPIYYLSCTFKNGVRKTKENAVINPVLCVDIDLQDNVEFFKRNDIEDVKYQLVNNSSVMAVYLSCGGRGLCVVHRLSDSVTKDTFIKYFKEIQYRYSKIGITIDPQCSNVNRIRYVSYDENVLINDIYEPYELKGIEEIVEHRNETTHEHHDFTPLRKYKINPDFDINNYTIAKINNIDGFDVMRRVWLSQTIKKFFGDKGKQLAVDIYCTYPRSVVKQESIKHLLDAYKNSRPACIIEIADDLVKLGVLVEHKQHNDDDKNVFDLSENEFLSDVINKVNFRIGYNMLVAGTGYGKTEVWKRIAKQIGVDGLSIHNVLVCEPRNSIITSKYLDPDFETVYGNKQFPPVARGLIVTNYDKLIRSHRTSDWFAQFEYFVIDESHLLFSEAYRDNSVMKFIDLLKDISDKTKIIFQTATPTDEDGMFNIPKENIFYVNKPSDKRTVIKYVDCYGDMIYNAEMIARDALENKRFDKVFVYNGTGSVINDEALKHNMSDKHNVLVYHRKSKYQDIMKLFDEQHRMSLNDGFTQTEYDVIVTSTAASVGIDINDECKVLVLIIGNITFEEEMQVAGRFRNCKDMEIRCMIQCGQYNDMNWYRIRRDVFQAIDNIEYNNENMSSLVINKQTMYNVPIGNVTDYNSKLLKYFQIKNNVLRSSYEYKIEKYKQYDVECHGRCMDSNLFELLKTINGFTLGVTTFKMLEQDSAKSYREIVVDNNETYRLYGDKKHGFVLCKKFYTDDDVNAARAYRKNITSQSDNIKNKLYDIIVSGQWKDDMYKYKTEYPKIERWIENTVKLYKYYKPLFDVCDKDMIYDTRTIYIIMQLIDYSQRSDYDWVEWFVIKLAHENKCDIDMCGYCYLLWCLFTVDSNKNKMMKVSMYDKFRELYDLFIDDLDDNVFNEIKKQIEANYDSTLVEDTSDIDDIETFMRHELSETQDIDVMCQRLHKSNYYTNYDINQLVEHINDTSKHAVVKSYDKLYKSMLNSNNTTSKCVVVTDKMNERLRTKYNLKIGQKFVSIQELVTNCNLSRMTVQRWLKRLYLSYE